MLDLLEQDWDVCVRQRRHVEEDNETVLQQSLIWQYIAGEGQSVTRATRRRIARAIFAIASPESLKDYSEVWEHEAREPETPPNKKQKLGNVDFETGEVADYDSDEEMKETRVFVRATRAIERKVEIAPPTHLPDIDDGSLTLDAAIERLGGSDAIALRQRLLALVSAARYCLELVLTMHR